MVSYLRNIKFWLLAAYVDDQVKEDERDGHVSCKGEKRKACRVLVMNLKERHDLDGLGIDRSIVKNKL
jgi:hypothetical protein